MATTHQEKLIIARWLVRINRTISLKDVEAFIHCEKNLVPHELKLKGKVGWDSTIPVSSRDYTRKPDWEAIHPSDELRLPQVCVAFYKCPRCNTAESSSCGDFQTVDLDKKHKCFYCSFKSEVKLWKCQCDSRWHNCPIHKYNNNATPENPKSLMNKTASGQSSIRLTNASYKLRKRKLLPPQHYDDALAEDVMRANKKVRQITESRKRKSEVALGEHIIHSRINPNLLGPILTRRLMEADNSRMVQ